MQSNTARLCLGPSENVQSEGVGKGLPSFIAPFSLLRCMTQGNSLCSRFPGCMEIDSLQFDSLL